MLGNVPLSLADTRKKEKPAMNDGRGGESAPTGVFLNTMELSRIEAPVYGQVEVYGIFQELTVTSEEAEFYVVLKGSRLTHVTGAKQSSDGRRLCFTLPGHDLPEMVSLTFYYHEDNKVEPCGSNTSLEYVTDVAQEIADYLTINRDHLVPQSYLEVQKRTCSTRTRGWKKNTCHDEEVSSGHSDYEDDVLIRPNPEDEAGLRELDEKITLAVANLDYLQHWRKGESQPHEAENSPRETLLHLAVRLDLLHLSRFLLHQPKGQRVLTLPNQEGDTPLQLAQKSKEHTLFTVLATSPVPAAADAVGRCCLWSDRSSVLTYHARNDLLTLTMEHAPEAYSHDVILVFRDKLREQSILKLITALRDCMNKGYDDKEDERDSEGVLCKELGVEDDGLIDNVFAEQLVLSLDDDEDKVFPSPPDPILCSGAKILNVPLESRINDSGQATPNSHMTPGVIGDVKYNISGVTSDSTGTDSRVWDTVEVHPLAMDTPPPKHPFQAGGCPLHPPPASTPLFPGLSDPDNRRERESPPLEICDLSPSLVALEVDSDEDSGTAHKSPFSDLSSDFQSGGDKMDAVESSPDLKCTHAKCASSASDPTALKMCDQGIRLRSYSYSSPKITLCASRNAQSSPTSTTSPEQRASGLLEQPHEKREVRFRRRAQSADDEGNMELAASLQHLTLSEFLKEIEEEDFDKFNIPSKAESDKYKVIRTFSFLKSRMSSTRNKSKGKGKDRDAKTWQLNAHCFATGSCVGNTVCLVCDKPASGKDLLHCSSCMVIIHKGCKESAPPCLKKLQDKYAVAMAKNKTTSLPQNFTVRESPPHYVFPVTMSLPLISPKERNDATALSNPPSGSFSYANDRQSESSETESDSWRNLSQSDQSELRQTATPSTSTESSIGEDCVDTYLQNDLAANAIEYEAESWSLSVEHKFCKKQDKRVVKRQDVIYELMQTEMHHLQTLHIMAEVFRRGMREEVQLDAEAVERVFPCLDQLLCFHHALFATMRERRYSSAHSQEPRNYLIQQIGDILLHQFSDENAERMKQIYGEFCSHHNEAVSFFKELQQHNKRFQNFIKQQSNNSLVRRREIPECILLVTQRITKYPVLLERVLQYTQNDTREHEDLLKALAQIREVITAVDLRVSEYERDQKLRDVWNRMENRSSAKLKNGHTFRKQDMMWLGQTLKHQGLLLWKTATGRLKDVLALLLTDTLIFLQEKDQKYTFATVDQKPPVISLQKLIVREVANEERGMFLISASAAGPEMYEVHASSKDERNTWMRLIRDAVESCPEEEEEYTSESEEERRAAEARMQKIHKLQESLMSQDQQICSSLEEKLQIYAELSALNWKMEASQLLVQPHSEDSPQAAVLLATALQETDNLKAMLSSRAGSPSSPSLDSLNDMFSGRPLTPRQTPTDCEALTREADVSEGEWPERNALQCFTHLQKGGLSDIDLKVAQSVQSLTQLLYSLQAAVTIQDSCYEVQRLLLSESKRPSPQSQQVHPASTRGHTLQEQEKQRNLEKQREEVAAAQRLQGRLRQERQRWERDCQVRQSLQGEQEIRLEERERQCHLETERLRQDREQLEEQLEEYQQSLERLREGQRSVEKEWQKLETQQKLFQSWRHSRQRSLPSMLPAIVIPLDGQQVTLPGQSYADDGSVFVNEAAFTNAAINNRHMHHKGNDPSAHNCLNTLLARSNHRQPPVLKSPEPHADLQKWALETSFFYTPPQRSDPHGHGQDREQPAVTGADQYQGLSHPSDPRPDCSVPVSLETESEEEDREENIVYL